MRALSVFPASTRAPCVARPQGACLISRRGVCVRRGELLTVRAAEVWPDQCCPEHCDTLHGAALAAVRPDTCTNIPAVR